MGKAAIVVLLIGFGFGRLAEAQQQTKVAKVGWLGIRPASAGRHEVIRRTLREIGYDEGNSIAFEDRFAGQRKVIK